MKISGISSLKKSYGIASHGVNKNIASSKTSFMGNSLKVSVSDTFESGVPKLTALRGDISLDQAKTIASAMKDENLIADGANKQVYQIGDTVAKVAKKENKDSFTTAENYTLEKLQEAGLSYGAKPFGLFSLEPANSSDIHYIHLQDKIDAKPLGLSPENYSKENFNRLSNAFLNLDKEGIVNLNLSPDNIAFAPNQDVKIFSFADITALDSGTIVKSSKDEGYAINSLFRATKESAKDRIIKSFSKLSSLNTRKGADIPLRSDNMFLALDSNASSFEIKTLYPYLTSGKCENPIEIFKMYTQSKGETYHTGVLDFLQSLGEDISKKSPNVQKGTQKLLIIKKF